MKKIINIILIGIIGLFLFTKDVHADVTRKYSQNLWNKCVNENTCLLLCGYTNQVRTTASFVEAKYDYFSSYVYYSYDDKKIFTEWYTQETDLKMATHKVDLPYKHVYIEDYEELFSEGICPSFSYIDRAGISAAYELCFSNNTKYCTKDKTNAGTTFKGESSLEYDYQTHVTTYFEQWNPLKEDYSCEELQSKKIALSENLVKDFSTNFLHSQEVPSFIINSKVYNNGLKTIEEDIDNLLEKCNQEAKQEYENGNITEEEYNNTLEKNNEGAEELHNQKDAAEEEIKENSIDLIDRTPLSECESLLGSPSDETTPAFYLSVVFKIMKYIAIILLIVLTIMDFVGAVASSDENALKKAMSKAIIRLILCVVIFLLPTLIEFILQFIHDKQIGLCGIGG